MMSCHLTMAQPPDNLWTKTYGGSLPEYAYSMQPTFDSGYIVAGTTTSNDFDVHGNHGAEDFWIVKLNSAGDTLWTKTLGGSQTDEARAVQQTYDSGFIVAGYSNSHDGDVHRNHGKTDFWVVKLNNSGDTLWTRSYGGSSWDQAYSIQQTNDSGYIVAGYSQSIDGDVHGNRGSYDYWIVKIDIAGDTLWTKTLGGSSADEARSIQQTNDSGFIVAGYTKSNDGDVHDFHKGNYTGDFWIVKLNNSGDTIWTKALGGSNNEMAYSIQQTNDSGYVVAGDANSTDGDVHGFHGGSSDSWIVKLNGSGDTLWTRANGGVSTDKTYSIQQTVDGNLIAAGATNFYYWTFLLDNSGDLQWSKPGGKYDQYFRSVQQNIDGDYILAGFTFSDEEILSGNGWYDFLIIKLEGPVVSPYSITHSIPLTNGWNNMSFNVSPVDSNMLSIVQPLIEAEELVKVIDETGGIIQDIPGIGWVNTIGNMTNTEGYYIRVTGNTELDLTGRLVVTPFTIPLTTGWNIMGYPLTQSQDALIAVQSLIDNGELIKVVDEAGGFIQEIPGIGWMNTILDFEAGEGYYIKVTDSTSITFDNPVVYNANHSTPLQTKTSFFPLSSGNPYMPMNIVVSEINIDGHVIQAGDEIAVFDNDILVGAMVISAEKNALHSIVVAQDDPLTTDVDGFTEGNTPVFRYKSVSSLTSIPLKVTSVFGSSTFLQMGTLVCDLQGSITDVQEQEDIYIGIKCIPNPANNYTIIAYSLPEEGQVLLEVFDINGRRIKEIQNEMAAPGQQQPRLNVGILKKGVYIIKLQVKLKSAMHSETIKFVKN